MPTHHTPVARRTRRESIEIPLCLLGPHMGVPSPECVPRDALSETELDIKRALGRRWRVSAPVSFCWGVLVGLLLATVWGALN